MSVAAPLPDALQVPREFTFEDKVYRACARTFEQEALFSLWVANGARRGIEEHRGAMDPLEYQQQLAGWRHDKAARVYDWGSPVCMQAAFSMSGMKYAAYLALKEGADKHRGSPVGEDTVERIFANLAKWTELQEIMGELNDPNRKRSPETQTTPATA